VKTFNEFGRGHLFVSASAVAILAGALGTPVRAQDPTIQIDLIGGWNAVGGGATQYGYTAAQNSSTGTTPLLKPRGGFDGEIDLAVTPAGSPWTFMGSVRYGRSNTHHGNFAQQFRGGGSFGGSFNGYYSGQGAQHETHLMVDFEVGHDVGIGMFGPHVTNLLAAGVRVARFTSTTVANLYSGSKYFSSQVRRLIHRSSTGAGPMVSWKSTVPIAGPFSLNLGASGALLIMDEKASYQDMLDSTTSGGRSGTFFVPNPEAQAALSFHPMGSPLSVSLGYRVDAYFRVLDGGWDTAHRVDRVFAGPFVDLGVKFR
jgi:hypothetical protein